MTDLEANQGGRNYQSVLHFPSDENEILYWCPACKSQNTQRLSTVHMSGLSQFSAVTGGIGWTGSPAIGGAWTTGTSQTQLSAIAALPSKKSYRNGLLLLFLSPLVAAILAEAAFLVAQRVFGTTLIYEQLATISFLALEVAAIALLLRVFAFNKSIWPTLFREWQMSFLCRRCGRIFIAAFAP
jgi:hypothetical protein